MSSDWYAGARAILNREWDPIHLSRMSDADEWNWADEYDHYRNLLAALIRIGVPDAALMACLEWAQAECIGLRLGPADHDRNAKVVAALRALGLPPHVAFSAEWPTRRAPP